MADADTHMPPEGYQKDGAAPTPAKGATTRPDGTLTRPDGTLPQVDGPSWVRRRRVLWVTMFFCFAVIIWCLGWGPDNAKVDTALTMSFGLMGSAVLGYLFGATYQDVKLWKNGGYSDGSQNSY